MAGTRLDGAIAQVLRVVRSSVDDVAGILHRDTRGKARTTFRSADEWERREQSIANGVNTDRRSDTEQKRDARGNHTDGRDYVRKLPGKWIQLPVRRVANAPALIADELERIHRSGVKSRWANYDPKLLDNGHRSFEDWLTTEGPLAPLNEHYGLNCWEMVGYAAARTGVLDKHQLRELFALPRQPPKARRDQNLADYLEAWLPRMGDWLIPEGRRSYSGKPGDPLPQRGDVVMWNSDAEHVAVATGRTGADGSPEVYSSWYLPKHQLTWDEVTKSYSQVTDSVQVTTVRELSEGMYSLVNTKGVPFYPREVPFDVVFGRGPW